MEMSAALCAVGFFGTALLASGAPALRGAPPLRQLSQFPENAYYSAIFTSCVHEPLVVHLRTEAYGHEVSWEILAKTGNPLANHVDDHTDHHSEVQPESTCAGSGGMDGSWYDTPCCLPAGSYTLVCSDSYGDGWNGGYLIIGGVEYCRDHSAHGDHNDFHNGYRMEIPLQIGEPSTVTQTSTTPHTTTETTTTATTTSLHTTTATDTETSTTSPHTTTATATSTTCRDEPWWFDSAGHQYDCAWYAGHAGPNQQPGDRCRSDGHLFKNFGLTANEACCICRELAGPAPAPTEPPQNCAVDVAHVQGHGFSPSFTWEIVPAVGIAPLQEQHWDIRHWNNELPLVPAPVCSGPAGSLLQDYQEPATPCCLPPGEYAFRCQSHSEHQDLNGESVMVNGLELCNAWGIREQAVRFQVEEGGLVELTDGPISIEPPYCRPHQVHVVLHEDAAKFDWQIVPYGGPDHEHWDIHNWPDASPSIPRPACSRPKGTYMDHFSPDTSCCLPPGQYAIRCRNSAGLQGASVVFDGQYLCDMHGVTEYAELFHVPY